MRADPQRIVVLSGDQLDTLCALGLQSRVVAAALPDGSSSQPSYLGKVIHDVPGAGSRSAPDIEAIKAATPDLILGSQGLTPGDFGELSNRGYGYLWWLGEMAGYSLQIAWGYAGQFIIILPDKNMIIVAQCSIPAEIADADAQEMGVLALIKQTILPAILD